MSKNKAIITLLILLILITSAVLILSQIRQDTVGDGLTAEDGVKTMPGSDTGDPEDMNTYNDGYDNDEAVSSDKHSNRHAGDDGMNEYGETKDNDNNDNNSTAAAEQLINEEGMTASERIRTPAGYERIELTEGSFGEFLRDLPVKQHGTSVSYYDGGIKPYDVHEAVIDIDVGTRDLQQCADAVIRLRAEYLYSKGMYDRIHFNFTNGFNAKYEKWLEGSRIMVSGNKAYWVENEDRDAGYESFRKYLDMVFAYAGTQSLSQEMKRIGVEEALPGDVFLKGGTPGHCVILIDMAKNPQTGERIFIIAQSYMPAQDIHILKNPANEDGNPWYKLDFGEELFTPEWTFSKDQVFRFAD